MNRWTFFILAGAVLSPGCLHVPDWFGSHTELPRGQQPGQALVQLPPPPPPVTPDQVNEANPGQSARLLQAELDYDRNTALGGASAGGP
jgi:hypothetical protein